MGIYTDGLGEVFDGNGNHLQRTEFKDTLKFIVEKNYG